MPEEYYEDENYVVFPNAFARKETDAAILVDLGEEGEHWFPKSQLHDDSEVFEEGTDGDLIVRRWLAEDRGARVNDIIERAERVLNATIRESLQIGLEQLSLTEKEFEAKMKRLTTQIAPGYCMTNFALDGQKFTYEIEEQPARGYVHCQCRDCFEIVIDGGLCDECVEAGCDPEHGCLAPHAYEQHCGDENCCGPLEDG